MPIDDDNLPIEVINNIPTGWQFNRSQIFITRIIRDIGNGFAIYLMYILTRTPTRTTPGNRKPKQVFTPEQEQRIGEIVTDIVTKVVREAIAPLVDEIRALRRDVDNIKEDIVKIKKHVGME